VVNIILYQNDKKKDVIMGVDRILAAGVYFDTVKRVRLVILLLPNLVPLLHTTSLTGCMVRIEDTSQYSDTTTSRLFHIVTKTKETH